MLKIDGILYPTDFSDCASQALPCALRLAERHDAQLHLLHALVLHEADPGNAAYRLPDMEELYEALEQRARDNMTDAVERHSGDGLEMRQALVRGISAASTILDYAEEKKIDLVVMGTHGRRGLRRLLLGSVTEEVVRVAPCPVLTVPQREAGRFSRGEARRLLVPVDFSEHARLALSYARELATVYDAELHLLHIVDDVVYPDFYPPVMPSGGALTDELRDQSMERMRLMLASLDLLDTPTHAHVRGGRAAPTIAEFAEEISADLIVIASHGLTGLSHMLLGSVTEQVVRRSPCPVFTVKAFGKQLVREAQPRAGSS